MQESILDGLQYTVVDTVANGFCPSPATIQGGGVSLATGRVAMVMEGPWYLAQLYGPDAAVEGGIPFDAVEPPLGTPVQMKPSPKSTATSWPRPPPIPMQRGK